MHARFKSQMTESSALNCKALRPRYRSLCWVLLSIAILVACYRAAAQSDPGAAKPYATLDRQSVAYRGPARSTEKDLPDGVSVIGMILPLQGPRQSEGTAIFFAVQLALEAEQTLGPLPDGRKLVPVARDESGPWGQASSEILKLVEQDHSLALLTSANGNSAHVAEQIANKIGIPILTLSSDPTTTQTNIPWLFRLGPSDTDQARAFCQRIYAQYGLQKVMLIVQMDHDGRIGAAEFEKAAMNLNAIAPTRLEITAAAPNLESFGEKMQVAGADAIVIWTDARLAEQLLPLIHKARPSAPVFLCQKAAQMGTENGSESASQVSKEKLQTSGEFFAVRSYQKGRGASQDTFRQLYLARTGATPGIAATEVYVAVHQIVTAFRAAGPNRVLLRDYLANAGRFHDSTRIVSFDPAGNSVQEFAIVKLTPSRVSETSQ